jgi:hypothetical protein
MENADTLKDARDLLLGLHKALVDFERSIYEGMNGKVTSGQFLNLLLEDRDFAWLRKFSTLIVEIDEMFAQKDGYSGEQVDAHLGKVRELMELREANDDFISRYQNALQQDLDAAGKHAEIKSLLSATQ